MRPTIRLAVFASLATMAFATSALSWASPPADDPVYGEKNMIEIGGGAFLGTGEPVEALIRVEFFNGKKMQLPGTQFVRARMSGNVAVGADGISYVDVQLETVGFQWNDANGTMGDVSLLNVDLERNIAIDNEVTVRVTLIGLKGQLALKASNDLKFILRGALDLAGLGYTRRLSDGSGMGGIAGGGMAEAGVQLKDRYRVAIGVQDTEILGRSRQVPDGLECYDYQTWDDQYRTRCVNAYRTVYDDRRGPGQIYATLEASITDDFKVFAEGACQVYSVVDRTNDVPDSHDHQWQLILGGTYGFRY